MRSTEYVISQSQATERRAVACTRMPKNGRWYYVLRLLNESLVTEKGFYETKIESQVYHQIQSHEYSS